MENKNKKSNKKQFRHTKFSFSLHIGISAALIWSGLGYLCYWLNFSKLSPSHFVVRWIKEEYLFRLEGIVTSILLILALSLLFAISYAYSLSHINTPWLGAALGVILWVIMFSWREMDRNTFYTTLSMLLLYGVFIGYSLSAEFSSPDDRNQET